MGAKELPFFPLYSAMVHTLPFSYFFSAERP